MAPKVLGVLAIDLVYAIIDYASLRRGARFRTQEMEEFLVVDKEDGIISELWRKEKAREIDQEEEFLVVDKEDGNISELWREEEGWEISQEVEVTNGGEYRRGDDTLPTDMSDSSDSGAGRREAEKCTSAHSDKLLLQSQFPFNIDQLFTMIFTNSKFNLELLAARGATDYVQAPWQPGTGGAKCRQVSYVLGLTSGPIGPKEVNVTETQVMNKCSKPGVLYSIDATSENSGIPYADYFTVEVHYCLSRVSDHTTLLTLYGHIKYKKSMWPMVKAFLEKNAMSGIQEYARLLESRLASESGGAPLARTHRRRRHAHAPPGITTAVGAYKSPLSYLAPRATPPRPAPARPAPILLVTLSVLLLINGLLYWKLCQQHAGSHIKVDYEKIKTMSSEGTEDWSALLEAHSKRQRLQLRGWREALDTTIAHLHQTEQALKKLLDTIEPSLNDVSGSDIKTIPSKDDPNTPTADERAHAPPEDSKQTDKHSEL